VQRSARRSSGQASPQPALATAGRPARIRWHKLIPYLFIAPFYVSFVTFGLGPMVFAFYMSLTNWTGLETPAFVGLSNFRQMLSDGGFWLSVVNSIWYVAAMILVSVPAALILAALLNASWLRGRSVFRSIYFLPAITSSIVIGLVFRLLYDLNYGVLNYGLGALSVPPIDWLGSPTWFKPAVIALLLWRWIGYTSIFFLAGLQAIPPEILAAGTVDGANRLQSFLYLVIPMLRPVILFVTVIATINSFQIFEEPYILSGGGMYQLGGPSDAGLSLEMYLYRTGFLFGQLGYGSAVGVTMFLLIFLVSLFELRRFGLFVAE
jgi:ABC-type sugar transport system permease subunit